MEISVSVMSWNMIDIPSVPFPGCGCLLHGVMQNVFSFIFFVRARVSAQMTHYQGVVWQASHVFVFCSLPCFQKEFLPMPCRDWPHLRQAFTQRLQIFQRYGKLQLQVRSFSSFVNKYTNVKYPIVFLLIVDPLQQKNTSVRSPVFLQLLTRRTLRN